jgi:hypothetical protein
VVYVKKQEICEEKKNPKKAVYAYRACTHNRTINSIADKHCPKHKSERRNRNRDRDHVVTEID